MRHHHADRTLDLLGRRPHQSAVGRRRPNRTVDHVVDLVGLEAENLG